MTEVVSVLLPLVGVLLGAWITYSLNVRQRRRTRVEDAFSEGIESLAVLVSSMGYVPHYGKWHDAVTEDERIELEKEVARQATLNHMKAIAEARDALARCVPYQPALLRYLEEPVLYVQEHAIEIITELREARG